MRTLTLQATVWIAFFLVPAAHAGPGDVDPSFVYPRPASLEPDSTNAIPLANGFLVVKSRNFESPDVQSTLEITRIDEDGRVVPTFGVDGKVAIGMPGAVNLASAVKGMTTGSMLLAGFQQIPGPVPDSVAAIARLDSTGRLDPAFGVGGIATVDVPGRRDRTGALEVLADGRILVGVWSSMSLDPYGDCSTDRVSLVRLNPDGSGPEVIHAREKNQFADNGCRNAVTLKVLSDQRFYFGSHVEIVAFDSPEATAWRPVKGYGCCHGPFDVHPRLGVVLTSPFVGGATLASSAFPYMYEDAPFDSAGLLRAQLSSLGFPARCTASVLVSDGDPPAWYLGFSSDGGVAGIAKLRSDGSLDSGWAGGTGVVRIAGTGSLNDYASEGLANDIRLVSVRPGGDTLVVVTGDGVIERRFAKSGPDRGQIYIASGDATIPEAAGALQVRVGRAGGTAGAVSINYRVELWATDCQIDACARPGDDFVASSGRLDWADGDGSDRTISIPIINDTKHEYDESFSVALSAPTGGAVIGGWSSWDFTIVDDDPQDTLPPDAVPKQSGGGVTTWPTALLLGILSLAALARRSRRAHLAAGGLLLAVAGVAHAGIGDMDPSFGHGGVLRAELLGLPLQDGRLLYRLIDGYGRTDVDGRPDPTFGNGGVRAWPAGFSPGNGHRDGVQPSAWARTRDGMLVAAGSVPGTAGPELALLRLRPDGDVDASFGVDGVVRVPSLMPPVVQQNYVEHDVALQLDGKWLVLTKVRRGAYGTIEAMELARLLPDGTPDPSFGTGGALTVAYNGGAEYVVLDALKDGRMRLGGDVSIYLTASGALDGGAPIEDPDLGPPARHWALGPPTADGGVILTSSDGDATHGGNIDFVAKLRADGSVDRGFGAQATGIVKLAGPPASSWYSEAFACSPDGRYLFVTLSESLYRKGVARYRLQGPGAGDLDPDFGEGGVVDLGRVLSNGPIIGTNEGGVVVTTLGTALRLLGVDRPSPGFVDLSSVQQMYWYEDQGTVEVRISRLAGSSGPLQIRYQTPIFDPLFADRDLAQPGIDFESVSGDLVWSDGDWSDKSFSIPLRTDGSAELNESLLIALSSLTPGGWVRSENVYLGLMDRSAPAPAPTPGPPEPPAPGAGGGHSGGGGGIGLWQLWLLILVRVFSRRIAT